MLNWTLNLALNSSKHSRKSLSVLISINWPKLVTQWIVVQKIYSKMRPVSCTNTLRDITDLVNHGMVKTTKTWISWKRKYGNFFYIPFEYNLTWSLEVSKLFLVTAKDDLESSSLKSLCLLFFSPNMDIDRIYMASIFNPFCSKYFAN